MPATRTTTKSKKPKVARLSHSTIMAWVRTLQDLLESTTLDEARTLPGSDPIYKSWWTEEEVMAIKGRIFYLIKLLPSE